MPDVGDILRLTLKQELLSQECLNVYFYRVDVLGNPQETLRAIALDVSDTIAAATVAKQVTGLKYTEFICENLTDEISIEQGSMTQQGQNMTAPLPSYVAVSMTLNRSTKLTRNASKRFAGIAEPSVLDNDLTQSWDSVGLLLGTTLILPDTGNVTAQVDLSPVVVGRTLDENGVYQLDLSKINDISGYTVSPKISTQNSRKERN